MKWTEKNRFKVALLIKNLPQIYITIISLIYGIVDTHFFRTHAAAISSLNANRSYYWRCTRSLIYSIIETVSSVKYSRFYAPTRNIPFSVTRSNTSKYIPREIEREAPWGRTGLDRQGGERTGGNERGF